MYFITRGKLLGKPLLILLATFFIGCGVRKKPTAEQESLVLAMTAPNSASTDPGACLFELSFAPSENQDVGRIENVHVIHRAGVSAKAMASSQNATLKRILNTSKESSEESVPQFVDEVRNLVASAPTSGISTDCLGVAKNLAAQMQARANAVAAAKSNGAQLSLNNSYYPNSNTYQYNAYGPTWFGGVGTPDYYANAFFNHYYGGYNSGDILLANRWSAIGRGVGNANDALGTADTAVSGCQNGRGQLGGCVVGAVKALGAEMIQGAAVNGGLLLMGAGRFIPQVGAVMSVFEPKATADGTMSSYCKTSSDSYCQQYRYTYR